MQDDRLHGNPGPSNNNSASRPHLLPFALNDTLSSTAGEQFAESPRPAKPRSSRLSHRSRAGCWTCRGRKVKCDEIHPRCGQCTRLNRKCDWNFRWNFSDSTTNTKEKFRNVKTDGNAVWDRSAHTRARGPEQYPRDDLPAFAQLTTEEDRESKARAHRPGTFGVMITPESFHNLPEYAAQTLPGAESRQRRRSTYSCRGGRQSPRPSLTRARTIPLDPNMVILDTFEDAPSDATLSLRTSRDSFPEDLQHLALTSPPYTPSVTTTADTPALPDNDHFVSHFRQHIVPRLVHPQADALPGILSQGSTHNVLEREARLFPPLRHAICAISALNLAESGRSSLEEAMENYHQALAAPSACPIANNLLSDGVFFRHYLLLVYDICVPTQSNEYGVDMWANHLTQLQRIAVQRHRHHRGREPQAYTIWNICELDVYACLMGSGTCDFVKTVIQNNILPPLNQQVPCPGMKQDSDLGALLPHEENCFPAILRLNEGVLLRAAIIAQIAQRFRAESGDRPIASEKLEEYTAVCRQAEADLTAFWNHNCPPFIACETLRSAADIHHRPRAVFDSALLFYHALIVYVRSSMFRNQRLEPASVSTAHTPTSSSDTSEHHVASILSLASRQVASRQTSYRNAVFAIFIAGCATLHDERKGQAIELIRAYEGSGIAQNTSRTRQLLVAVREEQRRAVRLGGRMESVEWVGVARERGLGVVNCGL